MTESGNRGVLDDATRLLLVEDNSGDAHLLRVLLDTAYRGQYMVDVAPSLEAAEAALAEQNFDAIVSDLSLPDSQGMETIERLFKTAPSIPIVVLTGLEDKEVAAQAVKCGAQDYLRKGRMDAASVAQAIRYAIDRKRAEEVRERLAAIVASSDDAIISKDLAGIILSWNAGAQRVFGYRAEEIIGRPITMLIPPELQEEEHLILQRLRHGERVEHLETVRLTKGGRRLDVLVTSSPIKDSQGRVIGGSKIVRDITNLKRAQDALRQKSEELALTNEELTRFTYTVSHDLKSPLVTIKTFLGYLEKDAAGCDAERVGKDIAYIRTAADRMSCLLDELLDLSRVGRKMNPSVEVPLHVLVQEALYLVAGQIAQRNVTIRTTDAPILLYGDRPRLVEVFQNLLDNAVKFMGDQPEPLVEIGADTVGDETVLFVRDNGIGIDPRYHAKLFGLFEKLDPHTEGTGMGLALVRRVVEVHGGRIWVESAGRGKGSTFHFTLAQSKRQLT